MEINKLIGNTPMIKIKYKYLGRERFVCAKLEYYNYTGSIKDRIANYIILESKKKGLLKDNMPIIEATSGNTGISFSALSALYNHPVHIFMPNWVSEERKKIMELYGAKVYLVSKEEGGFQEAIKKADILSKKLNGFRPNQFSNYLNIETHYNTTGKEILKQCPNFDAFVCGIGTGGTLMGVSKRIKEYNSKVKIIAMEPSKMPLLSQGKIIENHKIEGIGDDFIPKIVDKKLIDEIITVDDIDAINMSRKLSCKLGLGVGISSGANFLACVLSNYKNVVTIFCDDSKKYLSTDLLKENNNKSLISNQVSLISIDVV